MRSGVSTCVLLLYRVIRLKNNLTALLVTTVHEYGVDDFELGDDDPHHDDDDDGSFGCDERT